MEDRKLATILVPIFLSIFAILAVALRLIARRLIRMTLGSDDWTIIIALVRLDHLILSCVRKVADVQADIRARWGCLQYHW